MTPNSATTPPRQRFQMDNCPHLRRQRHFSRIFLAMAVFSVLARHTFWPDGIAPVDALTFGVVIAGVLLIFAVGLNPLRSWFGWGQHTPQPDEREALVAAYAKAQTHDLMMLVMPFALLGWVFGVPHERALAYGVIGMSLVMIAGTWFFPRRFNTRM